MEEEIELKVTNYDNQISLLYKAGIYFELPVRFISVRESHPDDETTKGSMFVIKEFGLTYEPYSVLLERYIDAIPNISLDELYNKLKNEGENILSQQDFIYLFTEYALQNGVELEEVYNTITNNYKEKLFQSLNDFDYRYNDWLNKRDKEYNTDYNVFIKLDDIQKDLISVEKEYIKPSSNLVVDRVTLRCYPLLQDGSVPSYEDGLDIFNNIQCSYFVPYAHYNEGTKVNSSIITQTYYKNYLGELTTNDADSLGIQPNLEMIIPKNQVKSTNKGNLIYATIWTGDEKQVITRPTREGYNKIIFDLNTGIMTFKTRITEKNPRAKEIIIERVKEAFPDLILGEITETRISGEFDIYLGEVLNDRVFLYDILVDKTFSTYLYIDERQTAFPEKKRITLHYRSLLGEEEESSTTPSSISAVISQRYITDDQTKLGYSVGTPYLRVNITKGSSRETSEQFKDILIRLLGIYLTNYQEIDNIYQQLLPPFEEIADVVPITPRTKVATKQTKATKKKQTVRVGKSKVKELREKAQNFLVKDYARRCQSNSQPAIITPDEVEGWKNKKFKEKETGKLVERQIMRFPPPPNDQFLFVCPNDDAPYPGIKMIGNAETGEYPYTPCCYKKDHMSEGRNSVYNALYRGKDIKPQAAKRRMKLITAKIAHPGGVAEIPITIERLLMRYSPKAERIKRYGVIRDRNSLIHCILTAINYKNYAKLSADGKKKLAREIRMSLNAEVNLDVMKQELYDFSQDDIGKQIMNNDIFFDPALYYRILEEFFNVNIYTFTPGKKPKEEKGESVGKIEIPRCKIFHTRMYRPERQTIIIYKHWGAEADALDYPHCELIVDYDDKDRINAMIFGERMTEIVHDILLETFPITTWSFQNNLSSSSVSLVTFKNLYSRLNLESYLGRGSLVSQIIDEYGKLRGVNFLPYTNSDDILMTVFCLPSQPLNLPSTDEINFISGQEAINILGEASSISVQQDDKKVIGLWFTHSDLHDYQDNLFVPIIPTEEYLTLPIGLPSPYPLTSTTKELSSRILLLERQIKLILQVIRWLFILAWLNNPDLTVTEFMTTYTSTYPEAIDDSATFYDLTSLPRKLPEAQTPEDAINILQNKVPSLFEEEKIVLYSATFAEKIAGFLENYYRQNKGNNLVLPRVLNNYYVYESDFKQQPRTVILVGQENFNRWISSLFRAGYQGISILSRLDPELMNRIEPYVFFDEESGVYYLGQNVEGGEIEKAVQGALTWLVELINFGFITTPSPDLSISSYRLFDISPSSTLRLVDEHIDPNDNPNDVLEILKYTEERYAALLPLSKVSYEEQS